MKNTIKFFALFAVVLGFAVSSYGQSTAASSSTATLIAPLTIDLVNALDFGSLASTELGGSAQILANDGSLSLDGGVTDPGTIAHQVATFTIAGEGSDVITVANSHTAVTLESGTNQLTVNAFLYSMDEGTATAFPGTATIAAGGSSTFTVGATLTVPALTPAGTYNSTEDFTITINYQ
jgi:hypothetical protein